MKKLSKYYAKSIKKANFRDLRPLQLPRNGNVRLTNNKKDGNIP